MFEFNSLTYSQENSTGSNQTEKFGFDLHGSIGLTSGTRLGTRFYFNNSFSVEGNFGSQTYFFIPSVLPAYPMLYGGGINFHSKKFAFSLLGSKIFDLWNYGKIKYKLEPIILISPTVGYLSSESVDKFF